MHSNHLIEATMFLTLLFIVWKEVERKSRAKKAQTTQVGSYQAGHYEKSKQH